MERLEDIEKDLHFVNGTNGTWGSSPVCSCQALAAAFARVKGPLSAPEEGMFPQFTQRGGLRRWASAPGGAEQAGELGRGCLIEGCVWSNRGACLELGLSQCIRVINNGDYG